MVELITIWIIGAKIRIKLLMKLYYQRKWLKGNNWAWLYLVEGSISNWWLAYLNQLQNRRWKKTTVKSSVYIEKYLKTELF
jgi:hypothetical protein